MAAVPTLPPHSPTSPAGSDASEPPSPLHDPEPGEGRVVAKADETATAVNPLHPVLCVGPRFDKEYPLHPNHWVRIGRDKKAQLLLKNKAVSRNHCSIRWDRHQRIVELRDTGMAGTLVNGECLRGESRTLSHGDRIRIEGKDMRFDFLLDLRPVGLGFADPREEQPGQQQTRKLRGPMLLQRRESLKVQLQALKLELEQRVRESAEKEREFHEIALRRTLRLQEDAQRQEELQKYLAGKKALEEKLEASRRDWLAKIQQDQESHMAELRPVMESLNERQVKLEKLQLKKDELERTIHPERYAVADVSRVGSYSFQLPTPERSASLGLPSRENSEAEMDGEADALGLPALALAPASGQVKAPAERKSPGLHPSDLDQDKLEEPEAKRARRAAGEGGGEDADVDVDLGGS